MNCPYHQYIYLLNLQMISKSLLITFFAIICLTYTTEITHKDFQRWANASCNVVNCKLCPQSPDSCQECDPTYYLVDTTQCKSCGINNCNVCQDNKGAIECKTCQSGYYLKDVTTCTQCGINNCDVCESNAGKITCTVCTNGYVPINNRSKCGVCNLEVPGCLTCNQGNSTCDVCGPQDYRQKGGVSCPNCDSKIQNCDNCDINAAGDTVTCSACKNGYYLQGNLCPLCADVIANCATCNNGEICIECDSAFYRNNSGSECVKCESQILNCLSCTPEFQNGTNPQCTDCLPNTFFINATYCQPCTDHIAHCSHCDVPSSSCLACVAGYYVEAGQCVLCSNAVENCQYCKGEVGNIQCTTCIDTPSILVVHNNVCSSCSSSISDCSWCFQDNFTLDVTCGLCANGKVLKGNVCIDSNPDVIFISIGVIGGIVLLGGGKYYLIKGFTVFKCFKRRKDSILTEETY